MYAIIAGANKAGSTSLFRYLSAHPEIRPARVKETNFFSQLPSGDAAAVRAAYDALFQPSGSGRVRLEASPNYLKGGAPVAERIRCVCEDVRLIVILREPASRLLSYFRSNRENMFKKDVAGIELSDYLALVEDASAGDSHDAPPGPRRNASHQYQRGCYAKSLADYLRYFAAEDLCILFFDDLATDPGTVMATATRFLSIDAAFYTGYDYVVENRTRAHRSRSMQALAGRANRALEPALNRVPLLRRSLRRAYEVLNERRQPADADRVDPAARRRLEAIYQPRNEELAALLTERFPQLALPPWLCSHARYGEGAGLRNP